MKGLYAVSHRNMEVSTKENIVDGRRDRDAENEAITK